MASYRISGVWKDTNNVITHYALHTQTQTGFTRAVKTSKARAVELVEQTGNTTYTWVWNYTTATWNNGENVTVVNGSKGKYLRSNPDKKLTDNLEHLINYDWITP